MYHRHEANFVVAEKNQGGDLVREVLNSVDPNVPVELVHASKGKETRAEPVVAFYEQGKVAHKPLYKDGDLGKLEDEMMDWVPGEGDSPDRVDALVWGLSKLMVRKRPKIGGAIVGPKVIS